MELKCKSHSNKKGGCRLLDIKSRNKAIDLVWLKEYLATKRETWMHFAADTILDRNASKYIRKHFDSNSRRCYMAQNWMPKTGKSSNLPKWAKRIVKAWKKKHNIGIYALRLTENQKMEMPIWLHPGTTPHAKKLQNCKTVKCLRNTHRIITVEDVTDLINKSPTDHSNRWNCVRCKSC